MRVYLRCQTCHIDLKSGIIDNETGLCFSQDMYYADHVQKGHMLILTSYPITKLSEGCAK